MFWKKLDQGIWIPNINKIIEKYLQLESESKHKELSHFKGTLRNMTTKNGKGHSLLHIAAMIGHFENFEILMNMMEDINPNDYSGNTPLDYACRGGHVKIFWILRNEITTEIDSVQLEFLMDENVVDKDNWRNIHCASALGDIEICKFFINNQVDLSLKTSEGMTPLFLAARGGHEEGLQDISTFGLSIKVPSISHHLDHQK